MNGKRGRDPRRADPPEDLDASEELIRIEFTDELDLHAFAPRDAESLVSEFLEHWTARAASGPKQLRIIHGKGIGAMRELVHAMLARHPSVERFALATDRSGWGATIVILRHDAGKKPA